MPTVGLFNKEGNKIEDIQLNDKVFAVEVNADAMHQVVVALLANKRQGTQSAKTRAEVRGGGIKPWRQKGTGRARQGSIRAPQWRGGGVVFGPTPRSYKFKINRKVGRLALKSALSTKIIDNEFMALDTIKFDAPKTKEMVKVLSNLEAPAKTLIVMDEIDETVARSANNIPGVKLLDARRVNVYDVLNSNKLIMTEAAIKSVEEVLG